MQEEISSYRVTFSGSVLIYSTFVKLEENKIV
jgi:hypothetical protein